MDGYQLAMSAAVMVQDKLLLDAVADERDEQDANVQKLQCAVNSAICEIARDFPIPNKMTATATDGVIPYPTDVDVAFVYRVTRNRKSVPFTFDSSGIRVARDGDYTVEYSAGVDGWEAYDDIAVADYVSMEMTALLVARNYCIMCGRLDEADVFDDRYEGYAQAIRLKRRAKLPPRAFV